MRLRSFAVLGLCLTQVFPSFADFGYQEKTQITGGSVMSMMKFAGAFSKQAREAGQEITSTVLYKGNRMARMGQMTSTIIDLDKETITEIDNAKRQYTVVTFQQLKQQMEQAAKEAEAKQKNAPVTQAPSAPPPEMSFDVQVRNTGAKKNVAGLDTSESILAMTMNAKDRQTGQQGSLAITNDLWMATDIPGYEEARDFNRRYALKLGTIISGSLNPAMFAMQPGMSQGMADMVKQMSKLKGVPVQQIMRVGTTQDGRPLKAASEAPLPPAAPAAPPITTGDVAQAAATSAIASKLGVLGGLAGGFSGFGHKKKADKPPVDPNSPDAPITAAAAAAQPTGDAVLIESLSEYRDFSTAPIDAAKLEVPAGYTQVERTTKHP